MESEKIQIPVTGDTLRNLGFMCLGKKRQWYDLRLNKRLFISINVDTKSVALSFTDNDDSWITMDELKLNYIDEVQNLINGFKK